MRLKHIEEEVAKIAKITVILAFFKCATKYDILSNSLLRTVNN